MTLIFKEAVVEVERIADQLKRAFSGEAWHGPSVRELLADVTAEMARSKPLPGAHSIWELALHILAWERVALRRIIGEPVRLSSSEDWPPLADAGEASWRQLLTEIEGEHERLLKAVSSLTDSQLNDAAAGEEYSIYFLLHGVIQHDLYHAGQIALLKKALSAASSR